MYAYTEVLFYRTSDNSMDIQFGFKYDYAAGGWKAYILTPLHYGYRPSDLHSTHRLYDPAVQLYYVCWTPLPATLDDCKNVVAMWSDMTVHYIRTGETLDSQFIRLYGGSK